MPIPFDKLSPAERIKFWQEIAERLQRVLEICQDQITPQTAKEAQAYFAHNELGLAWETICNEVVEREIRLPQPARVLLRETGGEMGILEPDNLEILDH